ncbi:MAG: hypothetical protein Q8W45_07025 [Candidatus Palauibacterales bacterium]|jgi:hypothetical protein|nr:hypothetical protein [Candidatus Palauibacterales bacterium]MDP2483017.1 hypothetical protein [Candidatus Palauibacterales bacterium]
MVELMKRTVVAVLSILACTAAFMPAPDLVAQETTFTGDWAGVLALPDGREIELIFKVAAGDDGALSTTLDVPGQGAAGIACTETSVDGKELHISGCEIPGGGGYDGTLNDEGGLSGQFNQAGMQFALDLAPAEDTE